uniref:Uncharacterized protein n=1 Tax=Cacopsylla melanoneura TaxID=428564 RepID=A0A8D9BD17_9HEMI
MLFRRMTSCKAVNIFFFFLPIYRTYFEIKMNFFDFELGIFKGQITRLCFRMYSTVVLHFSFSFFRSTYPTMFVFLPKKNRYNIDEYKEVLSFLNFSQTTKVCMLVIEIFNPI